MATVFKTETKNISLFKLKRKHWCRTISEAIHRRCFYSVRASSQSLADTSHKPIKRRAYTTDVKYNGNLPRCSKRKPPSGYCVTARENAVEKKESRMSTVCLCCSLLEYSQVHPQEAVAFIDRHIEQ